MGKPLVLMAPTDSEKPSFLGGGAVGSPYHPNATVNPSEDVGVGGCIGCTLFPCSGGGLAPSYTEGLCFPQSAGRGLSVLDTLVAWPSPLCHPVTNTLALSL